MIKAIGYAARDAQSPLSIFHFDRRSPGPRDIQIKVLYCGVCHSDLHQAHNDWHNSIYPMVPGHEIIGEVVAVGPEATKFRPGDIAGVGCMVDSCGQCPACREGLEHFCAQGATVTYNGRDTEGNITFGGYSDVLVVTERFAIKVPAGMDLKAAAPLLCAGITTYSPLRHWNIGPGHKIGVVGLGGLGHIGVKLAHAMGAEVTMITTSPSKAVDARHLGAQNVLVSTDANAMGDHAGQFDFILDTVPVSHDVNPYVNLLRRDGTLCLVGALMAMDPPPLGVSLMMGWRRISGSAIGSIGETQQLFDFCAAKKIGCDVEMIAMKDINTAFERLPRNDVKYRFVIDMQTLAA